MRAPVWPTWSACGRQPRFVTTRDPPTASPRSSASSSRTAKPSAPCRPPPAADDDARRVEADRAHLRLLPARDAHPNVVEPRRQLLVPAGIAGRTTCGATVSSFGEPVSRASSSRLPPQRWRVSRSESPSERVDAVGGERRVEQRGGVREHLARGPSPERRARRPLPPRAPVHASGAYSPRDPHRLGLAEPARERECFERDRLVVDEADDLHDATSASSRSTRRRAASGRRSTVRGSPRARPAAASRASTRAASPRSAARSSPSSRAGVPAATGSGAG